VSDIRNVYIFVLICIASLILQSSVLLNIHNQCRSISLTSTVYFIYGGKWHTVPDPEIDVNTVMQNRIESDAEQDILKGALVYKVQRRHVESAQDKSRHIWLLVVWHGERTEGLHVCASLIEYNKRLDESRLKKLYQKHWPLLEEQSKSKWALDDTTMLKTAIGVMNGGYRWDIFISERKRKQL
jgi:hypothetical protein